MDTNRLWVTEKKRYPYHVLKQSSSEKAIAIKSKKSGEVSMGSSTDCGTWVKLDQVENDTQA